MQVTFRGLALEQAKDMIFGTLVKDHWWILHKASGKTVALVTAPGHRAEAVATELARLRDWEAISDWSDDAGLMVFVARHPAEVELPQNDDDAEDDDWGSDIPYGDEFVPREITRKTPDQRG